jgi:hypothetical protein
MTWASVTTAADMSMYLARSGRRSGAVYDHDMGGLAIFGRAIRPSRPPAGGSPCCASATLTCRTSSASSTSPAPSTWDNREHAGHYTQATNYLGTEALTPADTGRLLTEIIREM